MSVLPINLPSGYVAIYGMGTDVSQIGIGLTSEQNKIRFGNVYQIWDGGAAFIYGGDSVMFKDNDVYDRIVYLGIPYTIIPARLVTKEEPPL